MKIYEYTESLSPVFSAKINIYFKWMIVSREDGGCYAGVSTIV